MKRLLFLFSFLLLLTCSACNESGGYYEDPVEAAYEEGYEAGEANALDGMYFEDSADLDEYYNSLSYDAGYENGYDAGHEEGYQEAYDDAYQEGYDQAMADLNPQPGEYCEAPSEEPQSESQSATVYVTTYGKKYHKDGCQHLSSSKIPISLEEAKLSHSPCSVCNPPA